MTVPAFHFEAKKFALRQAKDGVVVSFVVHPNDVRPELLSAPIGEHYIVALAPYSEEPAAETPKAKESPVADAKPKERWADMKRAKQAGIACEGARFRGWLHGWGETVGPQEAAAIVRERCGVASRADLDTDEAAGKRWDELYDRYLRETGQQTERRG